METFQTVQWITDVSILGFLVDRLASVTLTLFPRSWGVVTLKEPGSIRCSLLKPFLLFLLFLLFCCIASTHYFYIAGHVSFLVRQYNEDDRLDFITVVPEKQSVYACVSVCVFMFMCMYVWMVGCLWHLFLFVDVVSNVRGFFL